MVKDPQPAKKSYFFDKGYKDLANTIKGAWSRNLDSVHKYRDNLKNIDPDNNIAIKVLLYIVNIFALIAVLICGSAFTAVITVINVIVLVVFMALVYIAFSVIWLVDRTYLVTKKIFTACHECKEKSLIPTYICPRCGAKHTNLTPGVYGILKRKCNCGEELPTTFFNGRKELEAICPKCYAEGKITHLNDRESRPLCVPVVGGRSVGKTAFITAFSKEFIENIAPNNGLDIEFYNSRKEAIYQEILHDYNTGSTRMTDRPQDVNVASSVSFSFFVQHPTLKPERLIHIYDIAGEVFTDNNENEVQRQYEYCQGIVFIVDPFAIPSIRYKYETMLEPEDIAGIGKADINGIVDAFLNKLRDVTGLSDNKMSSVPIAIVISKADSAGLDLDIGDSAVKKMMSNNPEKFSDYYDTEDYLCRSFLKDNGMGNFLNSITNQFKNNRFFSCSAIGHTRDKGQYKPDGVLAPMEWIFRNADSKIGKIWHDNDFSKQTISLD